MGAVQAAAASVALSVLPVLLSGCHRPQPSLREPGLPRAAVLPFVPEQAIDCPPGYRLHRGAATDRADAMYNWPIAECGVKCDMQEGCYAFRYGILSSACELMQSVEIVASGASSSSFGRDALVTKRLEEVEEQLGHQVCRKKELRHFPGTEAPLFGPNEIVEQTGAHLQIGESIWLYAVGSSSLVWMTWVDQLHLALRRLGYKVPVVPANRTPEFYPRQVPKCDDTKYFQHLKTSRFGRIGWSSWDFALEGWEGCGADGFRMIRDLRVKCQHGAGCSFSKNPVRVSDIAQDASKSNITLVATWFNDDQHWSTHFKCFDGQKKDWKDIAPITLHCLLRTVRAIHAHNPHTWILIMAKYPETYKHMTYQFILDYNAEVKKAVEKEPKTFFVDFYMPNDEEGDFYQSPAHGGHPNCRGSKIMTYAVIDRLYQEGIISRSIRLVKPQKKDVLNGNCSALGIAACHTSALCWMEPGTQRCVPYGAGSFG